MPRECVDVSVIVPAWRAALTIGRTLNSIAAQTWLPREVIVVDDGSDDNTADIAESWRSQLGAINLKVLRQKNQGAGAARNLAIAHAVGQYLAFLDADDEWLPEKLERSLAELVDKKSDFVFHDMQIENNGKISYLSAVRHFPESSDPYIALCLRGFVPTSTVVVRRDAVVAAGGFDPTLRSGQDYELWLRLFGNHLRAAAISAPLTLYHVTSGSITARPLLRLLCNLRILNRQVIRLRARGRFIMWKIISKRAAIIFAEAGIAMMKKSIGLLSSVWLITVLTAYYINNFAYYREKLGVFGHFLFGG